MIARRRYRPKARLETTDRRMFTNDCILRNCLALNEMRHLAANPYHGENPVVTPNSWDSGKEGEAIGLKKGREEGKKEGLGKGPHSKGVGRLKLGLGRDWTAAGL